MDAFLPALLILLACVGLGSLADRWALGTSAAWRIVSAAGLGFGVGGTALLGIGLIQLPSASAAWLITGLFAARAVWWLASLIRQGALHRWHLLALIAVLFPAMPLLLSAFHPNLEIDEVVYHLSVPKAWRSAGFILNFPYEPHSQFHFLHQMSYLWAFVLRPDAVFVCRLLELGRTTLAALAAGAILHQIYGSRGLAVVAAMLVMLMQDVIRYAPVAQIDAGQALHAVLGAGWLALWIREPDRRGWLVLGALFLGFVAAVKNIGLFTGAALMAGPGLVHLYALGWRSRRFWIDAATAAGCFLLPVLPWMAKSLVYTGNPLFPFAAQLFPLTAEAAVGATYLYRYYPPGAGSLIPSTAHLYVITSNAQIIRTAGVLVLVPLAGLCWMIAKGGPVRPSRLALIVGAFLVLPIFLHTPFFRFFIAVYPMALVACLGELSLLPVVRRWRIPALVAMLLVTGHFLRHAWNSWFPEGAPTTRRELLARAPALTAESARAWREKHDTAWPAIKTVNATLGERDRLLASAVSPSAPLLSVPFIPNLPCIALEAIGTMASVGFDADRIHSTLLAHDVTHVLTREAFDLPAEQEFAARHLELIASWEGGWLRLYRIQPQGDGSP